MVTPLTTLGAQSAYTLRATTRPFLLNGDTFQESH